MRNAPRYRRSLASRVASAGILVLPAAGLAVLAARTHSTPLWAGAGLALLGGLILLRYPAAWRPPASGAAVLLHLTALAWAFIYTKTSDDPLARAVRGGMLLAPVMLLAAHDLHRTGAEPRRRANRLCQALRNRVRWPDTVADIRLLPEVRELRFAAEFEAGPVFNLFGDPRPEVRAAAFAALEGRRGWRPREASALLAAAQKTYEPQVRALAVTALGSVSDAQALASMAAFLRDPAPEVRTAAATACADAPGRKWTYVRDAVRAYLSDPKFVEDGGLPGTAGHLSAVSVCDLTAWSGEGNPLGIRAVRTLADHYAHVLQTNADYDLMIDLSHQVTDPVTPAGLRVELAALLRGLGLLSPELLDRMSNSDQPGPVRLLAAEALLAADPTDADGIDVLRGLGRQSNREMALAIARIVQTYLKLDMGLPPEGLDTKSKQAGDVARRVFQWAVARVRPEGSTPTPGSGMPGILQPPSSIAQPGLPAQAQAPSPSPQVPGPKKLW